jgi:hypothetical protein
VEVEEKMLAKMQHNAIRGLRDADAAKAKVMQLAAQIAGLRISMKASLDHHGDRAKRDEVNRLEISIHKTKQAQAEAKEQSKALLRRIRLMRAKVTKERTAKSKVQENRNDIKQWVSEARMAIQHTMPLKMQRQFTAEMHARMKRLGQEQLANERTSLKEQELRASVSKFTDLSARTMEQASMVQSLSMAHPDRVGRIRKAKDKLDTLKLERNREMRQTKQTEKQYHKLINAQDASISRKVKEVKNSMTKNDKEDPPYWWRTVDSEATKSTTSALRFAARTNKNWQAINAARLEMTKAAGQEMQEVLQGAAGQGLG